MSTPDNDAHPCPLCAKVFKTKSAVQNHMNQKNSHCRYYYENVMHFSHRPLVSPFTQPADSDRLASMSNHERDSAAEEMDVEMADVGAAFASIPEDQENSDVKEATNPNQQDTQSPFFIEYYPRAAKIQGQAKTFMDIFDEDEHASKRANNLYYPFASAKEWEVASFLLKSGLSMAKIDEFLKLELVSHFLNLKSTIILNCLYKIKNVNLSFRTVKDLRNRAEILPSGPRWKSIAMETPVPATKQTILFHRNSLECLEALLRSPLLNDHLSFTPFRLYESAAKQMRFYTEWLSGDAAWFMQVSPFFFSIVLRIHYSQCLPCRIRFLKEQL